MFFFSFELLFLKKFSVLRKHAKLQSPNLFKNKLIKKRTKTYSRVQYAKDSKFSDTVWNVTQFWPTLFYLHGIARSLHYSPNMSTDPRVCNFKLSCLVSGL
jgi:hypothetical protein